MLLYRKSPTFLEGLFLGLIGLLQGVLLFGVSSYMAAQRRSARSLGRSLGKIETKLDKIERGLSRIPVSSGEQHSNRIGLKSTILTRR